MKSLFVLLLSATLGGCALIQGYTLVADDKASAAADIALQNSEARLCRYVTVGAWARRYGGDPQKADAWRRLCTDNLTQLPK